MQAYGFIYITENLINGKQYIGQRRYRGRWQDYLGSGKILIKAIKTHGVSNFRRTIIYDAFDLEELNKVERHFIELFNAVKDPNWYNLANGGRGSNAKGFLGKKHSPETIERMRNSQRGHPVSEKARRAVAINGSRNMKSLNSTVIVCPHCGTSGTVGPMNRWHFDSCKLKVNQSLT